MHHQTIVGIQDLRFVTLHCRHCNTRLTIDLEVEREFRDPRAHFSAPRECPRCEAAFHAAIPPAIEGLQKVYKALAAIPDIVTFTSDTEPLPENS